MSEKRVHYIIRIDKQTETESPIIHNENLLYKDCSSQIEAESAFMDYMINRYPMVETSKTLDELKKGRG